MKAIKSASDLTMLGNGFLEYRVDARIDSAESERKRVSNRATHLASGKLSEWHD